MQDDAIQRSLLKSEPTQKISLYMWANEPEESTPNSMNCTSKEGLMPQIHSQHKWPSRRWFHIWKKNWEILFNPAANLTSKSVEGGSWNHPRSSHLLQCQEGIWGGSDGIGVLLQSMQVQCRNCPKFRHQPSNRHFGLFYLGNTISPLFKRLKIFKILMIMTNSLFFIKGIIFLIFNYLSLHPKFGC